MRCMISDCPSKDRYHGRGLCTAHYWEAYKGRIEFPKHYDSGRKTRVYDLRAKPDKGHPLLRLMFEKMAEQQLTLGELSRRAGVSYASLHDWRRGGGLARPRYSPRLENLEACLNVLGYRLAAEERPGV